MPKLLVCRLDLDTGSIRHHFGLPPSLTGGQGFQSTLPAAEALAIVQDKNGFFLFRYQADGTFCGDTWHPTLSDATEQASSEYPGRPQTWTEVDSDEDPAQVIRRMLD